MAATTDFLLWIRRKNTALFGAITDPEMGDFVSRQSDRFLAINLYRTLTTSGQTHDGAHGSGTPGAIASQDSDDLTGMYFQIHFVQDMRFAIPGLQVLDFQCANWLLAHAWAPSSSALLLPI